MKYNINACVHTCTYATAFYSLIEVHIYFPLLFIAFHLNLWTLINVHFQCPDRPLSSHFMIVFHALSCLSAQFCRKSKDLQTYFSHVLLFSVILNGATDPVISTSLLHFSLNFYVFLWSYLLLVVQLISVFLFY